MSAIETFARQCVIYVNDVFDAAGNDIGVSVDAYMDDEVICQVKSSGRVETAEQLAGLMRDLCKRIGELALESATEGEK